MRKILFGDCSPERLFSLVDPDEPTETEFEHHVVKALSCLYPEYRCILFGGPFRHNDRIWKPDLALVARNFSHWFVIEVELTSHSFENHVLPQVKAFQYGEPEAECASALCRGLSIELQAANTLLSMVPRSVAVVANRRELKWEIALAAHGIQLLTVSAFTGAHAAIAVEVEGTLDVVREHLGFGQYSAADRSLRFAAGVRLPSGQVQIDDPSGSMATWTVVRADKALWVTKDHGAPNIPNGTFVQVIRTVDGRLSIRWR